MSYNSSSASPSADGSIHAATKSWSPESDQETKTGRPNKWTASRSRKLARLYLYSLLPPKDIPQALRENEWIPGKESTTKTVSSLLDSQPRWLRPKNREEMDKRIAGLSECKALRKSTRTRLRPDNHEINQPQVSERALPVEFTETPLEDLLQFAPEQPLNLVLDNTSDFQTSAQFNLATFDQGIPYQDEQVLPLTWDDSCILETANTLPAIDQRSLSTYISTSSLKKRLPRYSTQYLKCINRLLEGLTISDTSASTIRASANLWATYDDGNRAMYDEDNSSGDSVSLFASPGINGAVTNADLLLPNAFLSVDHFIRRQGLCIPGLKPHDSKSCWCAVVDELQSGRKFWVCGAGLVMDVTDPPNSLKNLDLNFRDSFGNTLLHLLAARDANFFVILDAMELVKDINAKNTAGQSFLHVLHRRFIRVLVEDGCTLIYVLQRLNHYNVRFHDCDVLGRSFLHILTHRAKRLNLDLKPVFQCLNVKYPSSRDAFGWTAVSRRENETYSPSAASQTIGTLVNFSSSLPTLHEDTSPSSTCASSSAPASSENGEALLLKHARLLETARLAFIEPSLEDAEGRNGLHCLAEASLTMNIKDNKVLPSSLHKRKRDLVSEISPVSPPLKLRYQLVQEMLSIGVYVNSYDAHGNTVLMALVTHLNDGEDDRTLAELLRYLIHRGANIYLRNRVGETALHMAVRLGRKVATRVLLEHGANVHVRTAEGKGVLALGEAHYLKAREEQGLYASIMACMALAIQYGAVAAPTLVQEWSTGGIGEFF